MTLTQITKVKGPGIHTLANIVSNTISLGGIATASNFKTGTSNLHNIGLEIAGINVLGADTPIGTGATIYDAGGAIFTGVVTATKFIGQADISGGSIVGTSATFTGNVSIGGTLTYEDVTNIDSVGLITARNGLHITGGKVGIGITNSDGLLTIKGDSDQVTTPSIRLLDGSDTREVSITNEAGDFIASVHGNDNAIHGHIKMFESGIFDINNGGASGSNVNRLRITSAGKIQVKGTRGGDLQPEDDDTLQLYTKSTDNSTNRGSGITFYNHDNSGYEMGGTIQVAKENGNADDEAAYMRFSTRPAGGAAQERLRIKSDGTILPGTNNATSIGDGTTNFNTFWASTRFRGNDNVKLILGNAQDFVIRHDGSNNIIGSPVGGDLHIKSGTGDNDNQLIAAFKHSNGSVGIGTDNPDTKLEVWSTGNNNSVLKLSPGTTAGNYGGIELGRTDGGGNVRMTTVVKGGVPISGISGIEFGSSNTNLPAVSLASANTAGGHIAFKPKGSEKMRIASDGKILMGVAASNGPAAPLHIYGGSDTTPILAFTRSTVHDDWQGAGIGLDDEGGTYKGALTFYTHESSGTKNDSVTEKMRITSSGKVGINQTDPYYNLQINFNNATSTLSDGSGGNWGGAGLRLENDNTTAGSMSLIHFRTYDADWHFGSKYVSSNNSDLVFLHEGTDEALRITSAGNATFSGIATATNHNLSAISTTISDTAVDLFVYDTRKDSDGGAWRKRTSHTSWYNETFSSTRGSKKEFPAVAVIVAETGTYTIYDGDDPSLPLWMKFQSDGSSGARIARAGTSAITMLNGLMCAVRSGSQRAAGFASFIDDTGYQINNNGKYSLIGGWDGLVNRNVTGGFGGPIDSSYAVTGNGTMYDVAMTVLPNAPIDEGTELPKPTIAIATNSGVSIISHNDKIFNYTRSGGNEIIGSVAFDKNNDLIVTWGTSGTGWRHISRFPEPFDNDSSFDTNKGYLATDLGLGASAAGGGSGAVKISNNGRAFAIDYDGKVSDRLGLLDLDDNSPAKSLGAFINSSANSGWCVGDITRAWLCSTDTTNVTGSQKVTNGTFDSNVNSWTNNTNATKSHQGGQLRVTSDNGSWTTVYQAVTLVVGKRYTLEGYVHGGTASNGASMNISSSTTINSGGALGSSATVSAGNWISIHVTFIATATTMYVHCQTHAYSSNQYSTFDVVSLIEAEEDMSINKKGICVFGTVPKQAVASGAELVSYGPFSNSNYLEQAFDEDFEYGTGDYSVSVWFKTTGSGIQQFMRKGLPGSDQVAIEAYMHSDGGGGEIRFVLKDNDGSSYTMLKSAQSGWNDGLWHHYVGVREGALLKLYLDGRLNNSAVTDVTHSVSWASMSSKVTVGRSNSAANPFTGELALMKIAGDAPTDEQVKKIYNDEKKLFAPNAKCTLYGSSDTVTAVAYDDSTDTAYAGTSAGRSDFTGLNRINNTTSAVTAAISASNGLVVDE